MPDSGGDNQAFVRGSLQALRRKLLDLTKRNPLIAFKHGGRSRRYIRAIDELPDQLYSRLSAGSPMQFKSLGTEETEPADERTIVFRRALDAAKLEDADYLDKVESLGDDPGERALERLELDLRIAVRERLGLSQRDSTRRESPADAARRRGLDPTFDLPVTSTGRHHEDAHIQTFLFDADMARRLTGIHERVRLSLSEMGVNPLFCVFGFLEWYEDANSEVPLHAPLLLLPLSIDYDLVRGTRRYKVQSSGEGATTNIALAERLKRDFQITLPPFGEDDTPDRYFAEVQGVIEHKQGWRIRRWITFGLFSFARIAMYNDLNPDNWQTSGGLESHPRLNRLLGGGDGGLGRGTNVSPNDADADETDIPLIADADSSQVAAIRDVLAGRDMVIEGPPGTGKSQTITNIIAAFMATGKRVLFVAEKMAALNVVKNRLEQAGLDGFCLELHSSKASRGEVIKALARRLGCRSRRGVDIELEGVLRSMMGVERHLGASVEALGSPAGQLGITVQELFWKCHAVRARTASAPAEIDDVTLDHADRTTTSELGRMAVLAEDLERARKSLRSQCYSLAQHPWRGVAAPDLDPFRAENVVRRVQRLSEAAARAEMVLKQIESLTEIPHTRICDLQGVIGLAAVPDPGNEADDAVIGRLLDPHLLAGARQFLEDLKAYGVAEARCRSAFRDADAAEQCCVETLAAFSKAVADAGLSDITCAEVVLWPKRRQEETIIAQSVADLLQQIASSAEVTDPSPAVERALVATVDLAAEAGMDVLSGRWTGLVTPGASTALGRESERAAALLKRRAELAPNYVTDIDTTSAELRAHAAALRAAPAVPLFSSKWRMARRAYRGVCRHRLRANSNNMASVLEELGSMRDDLATFKGDAALTRILGDSFRGVESDFKRAIRIARWADDVRLRLPVGDEATTRLQRLLLSGPIGQVESLAAMSKHPRFGDLKEAVSVKGSGCTTKATAKAARDRFENAAKASELAERVHLRGDLPIAEIPSVRSDLGRTRGLRGALDDSRTGEKILGGIFRGHKTPAMPLEESIAYIESALGAKAPAELRRWLVRTEVRNRLAEIRAIAESARTVLSGLESAVAELERVTQPDYALWLGFPSPLDAGAKDLSAHAQRCADDPGGLQLLIDDLRLSEEMRQEGFGPLLDLLEGEHAALDNLADLCRRVLYQSLARLHVSRAPALAGFTGDRHEGRRKEFRELDRKILHLRQKKIASDLAGAPIDPGCCIGPKSHWTGVALVQHEAGKQMRHIPIRDLLDRAGLAVQQMMPCFMMSPLTVAQYLKPEAIKFDVVVMDEASQLRPEDAVGAIARGAQIVIVGDPKQLPPTNFFMTGEGSDELDDPTTVADEKSVLDAAMSVLRPVRRLTWHYRSRHASLIAYSNQEFYDSSLIVFPSPHRDSIDFGVQYVHVSEGQYRRSINPPEAQRVASAAIEYALRHPERSLGIVALNQAQAELVSLEVDRIAGDHPEFEAWRKKCEATLEPFFVKNLENVQGDERDTIFVSTVYGRNETGNMYQRFGPINSQGGHRRLNVLFTRAKCQVKVFSSMLPEDIRADESSPWGVRALKGYMKFARDGLLDMALGSGRAPDSEFEVAVSDALRSVGFEVTPQVGVVGYFIDMAVHHPERAGEFVLGVECDGAMYHSSKSARDRDRLRQEVLERLNWRIHRIWSLDWYRNPPREIERLIRAVREAVAASQ